MVNWMFVVGSQGYGEMVQALQWLLYELNCDKSELDLRITTVQRKSNNRESLIEAVGRRHDECQIQSPALEFLTLSDGFDWPGVSTVPSLPRSMDVL